MDLNFEHSAESAQLFYIGIEAGGLICKDLVGAVSLADGSSMDDWK